MTDSTATDRIEVSSEALRLLQFKAAWYSSKNRGRSSDALVAHVLGGPEPKEGEYPLDWWDFRRCIGAYEMACNLGEPYLLPKAMQPTMCLYAEYVAARRREFP